MASKEGKSAMKCNLDCKNCEAKNPAECDSSRKRDSVVDGLFALAVLIGALSVLIALCGCASNYSLGMLRDDMRNGDKALWRDQRFQNERIQTLEQRVYHLERGELLDHPAKEAK